MFTTLMESDRVPFSDSRMFKLIALLALTCLAIAFPPRHGDPFNPLGSWHRRGSPCGLPIFFDKLPEDAQEKVKAIWADYKEGNDCESEHTQTREIVKALPEDIINKVFAGQCGPTFLRNVSATVRKEFRAVWFDHRLSLEDKELSLKKLAYSLLSGESLALFNKWEEELQVRKAELAKKVDALSPDAKNAYGKWKELRLKEKEFLAALPKEIREELRNLMGYRPRPAELVEASTTTEAATTTPSTTTTTTEASTTTAVAETTAVDVSSTTEVAEASTTAKPIIEEKVKEKEFAVFLDVSMSEELTDEAQCSYI